MQNARKRLAQENQAGVLFRIHFNQASGPNRSCFKAYPLNPAPNVIRRNFNDQRTTSRLRGSLDAFVKTCQRWKLGVEKQMILLGYEPEDAVGRQVLAGHMISTSKDYKDRIAYVIRISLGLGTIFDEGIEAERQWLNQPRSQLNNLSALDYMLEGHMSNLFVVSDLVEQERGL